MIIADLAMVIIKKAKENPLIALHAQLLLIRELFFYIQSQCHKGLKSGKMSELLMKFGPKCKYNSLILQQSQSILQCTLFSFQNILAPVKCRIPLKDCGLNNASLMSLGLSMHQKSCNHINV